MKVDITHEVPFNVHDWKQSSVKEYDEGHANAEKDSGLQMVKASEEGQKIRNEVNAIRVPYL